MSGNVVAWVFKRFPIATEVDRNRKIILSEVAEAANRDFSSAHPGVQPICDHWGFHRTTVIAHLKWLVENGWLEVTERGQGRKATVYRVCEEKPRSNVGDIYLSDDPQTSESEDSKRRNEPPANVGMGPSSPYVSSVNDSPLENARGEPDSPPVKAKGKHAYDEGFARWWEIYPRKDDKGDAERAYLAARKRGGTEVEIEAATEQYLRVKESEGVRVKYLKHAATFLNSDRWKEWLAPRPEAEPDDPRMGYDFPEPPAWITDERPGEAELREKMIASFGWEGRTPQ